MRKRDVAGDWEYEIPCPVSVMGTYSNTPSGEAGSLGVLSSDALGLAIPVFLEPCSPPESLSLSLDGV